MPLVAMVYTRGPKINDEYNANNVKHAARVGAELGADIVKVPYTGSVDTFAKVVEGCPVPVVIAGGPKMGSDEEIFKMVEGALAAGSGGRLHRPQRLPAQDARQDGPGPEQNGPRKAPASRPRSRSLKS